MNQPAVAAQGILLSDVVNDTSGALIDDMARAVGVPLRRYTAEQAQAHLSDISAAFFSRELYEGSSLKQPGTLSNAFFRLVDASPNLRWLHVCSSGLDLPQYARSLARGVRVTGSTGTTAVPIAQTVLAAILAQARGFDHWVPAQANRTWAPLTGVRRPKEVSQQHVVVLGTGPIGCEIGRLLKLVGFRITAVRRNAVPTAPFDVTIDFAQLDTALPACDWLVLALPLTPETRGLMDQRRLALLPRHARLVNVARGELVDESALENALGDGRLRGAYLDTFVEEPLPESSPLWSLPTVWISPHNSAASQGHEERVVNCFLKQFEVWLAEIGSDNGYPIAVGSERT